MNRFLKQQLDAEATRAPGTITLRHIQKKQIASIIAVLVSGAISNSVSAQEVSAQEVSAQEVSVQKANAQEVNKLSPAQIKEEIARLNQLLQLVEKEQSTQNSSTTTTSTGNTAPQEESKTLGAITVRGAKPIELQHDVPIAISAISGVDLSRDLSQDYSAFTRRAAGITFNQSNTRGASLSVRGIGKRAFAEVQDPSVLTVLDGVSFGLTSLGNFDFYDIDSVEAARGVQGTLGGKGATSGVVSINSKRPSFTPSSDFSLTFGQRDSLLVQAAQGGPLIDGLLAWRGAISINKIGGSYYNEFDRNYSFYNRARVAGRTQFLLTPDPDLRIRFSLDVNPHAPQLENGLTIRKDTPLKYDNGTLVDANGTSPRAKLFGFENANNAITAGPRDWFVGRQFGGRDYKYYGDYVPLAGSTEHPIAFNENQGQTVSVKGASTEVNWDVANHTFTSLTAWRKYSFDAHNDEGTPYDISLNGGGGVYFKQYSQEFRINSKPGGVLDYQAGLFYLQTRDDVVSKTGWGSDAGAWFATAAQYNLLDTNAAANRGAGRAILSEVLDNAVKRGDTFVETKSLALFGQADWHLNDQLTLTSGLRVSKEDRSSEDVVVLDNNGRGAAFNPVAIRGYDLGGFAANGSGVLASNNSVQQLAVADAIATRYYGIALNAGELPGTAYNKLSVAQKAQVGAARAIRNAQIGQLIKPIKSTYKDTLYAFNFTPNYRINDDISVYASVQYGDKSGTGYNVNGVSRNVKPEHTSGVEFGAKTFLLNKTLTLNADIYAARIKDYQQAVRLVDQFQTDLNIVNGLADPLAYISAQGNVNKVGIHGLELDASYSGIPNLNIRFGGVYNLAKYLDYKNAPKTDELNYLTQQYIDLSGQRLPSAPKFTGNLGLDYRIPVFGNHYLHSSLNAAYISETNITDNNSLFGRVGGYTLFDASIGLSKANDSFDVSLVVKNLTNKNAHEVGWASYTPEAYRRWAGIKLSAKL
ncbi:TonB-dependent receptor [Undibacterium flavidum]|uniref:TonB-dependent receptor n=1 Tax=Undibacterium flavidum TaxID=2762297 RepID=A0ABR6Y978_9BURK|nr:TonB-dependent receptor [Undibacterium flavidum]MBC3873170.1 TonB-dependent receptor [Undibacterium flavidum]